MELLQHNPESNLKTLQVGIIPWAYISLGQSHFASGSMMGFIQIVLWRWSVQLSMKWLGPL